MLRFLTALMLTLVVAGCQYDVGAIREKYDIVGVDVSRYQLLIDWEAVAGDSIDFAYIKASEGLEWRDIHFNDNWREAGRAGIIRGAYHFYRPGASPIIQAENYLTFVDLQAGDLVPVLDVETLGASTSEELVQDVGLWLEIVEEETGVRPMVYTNFSFYYDHLLGNFDEYPFWIARYNAQEPAVAPTTNLLIWQFTDRGRVAGIDAPVDLNGVIGNTEGFTSLLIKEGVLQDRPSTSKEPQAISVSMHY